MLATGVRPEAREILDTLLGAGALDRARAAAAPERVGTVNAVVGLSVDVAGLPGAVGDVVHIDDAPAVPAEVVAVTPTVLRCMPLGPVTGLRTGMAVRTTGQALTTPVGDGLLGRVLDGLGRPADGLGPVAASARMPVTGQAPSALGRARVAVPLSLGVRALDTLATVGRGQRLGLFAGSGVGKSSLLSMVARGTEAEVSVIALVGERGREVREFLEDDLGPEGLARSVVVVATSDEPPLVRLRAAFVATRIAEEFRAQGRDVVLMMDSLTRVAMAQREIGLSVGEPPATRGYPPSTFSLLAQLLERAGTAERGSVTGIYTVLVDGDDHNEPIADAARSILDGHVVLTRDLAVAGHFPSIDVLGSVSRVASRVTTPEQRAAATALRRALAAKRRAQDLIDVGAYAAGSNPLVDAAVAHGDEVDAFLRQPMDEVAAADDSWSRLTRLVQVMGVR
jgi:flagellum-specific ATP synthase